MEIHEIFDRKLQSLELTEIRINEINKKYADEYLRIMNDSIDKVNELDTIQPVSLRTTLLGSDEDYISCITMTNEGAFLSLEYKDKPSFKKGYDNDLVNKLLEDEHITVSIVDKFIDINYVKEKNKTKKKI